MGRCLESRRSFVEVWHAYIYIYQKIEKNENMYLGVSLYCITRMIVLQCANMNVFEIQERKEKHYLYQIQLKSERKKYILDSLQIDSTMRFFVGTLAFLKLQK